MIANANSGHTGIALGAAPIMYALFHDHIIVNPKSNFFNRDRFVLSAGHGSALLYATMYVSGYSSLTMDDLKHFRQYNSKTPGHPESYITGGVDATTGPLGQGIAMGVGLAMAEAKLANKFNKYNKFIDHYTYVLFGDGCLQEGVALEAISFAGKQKLKKLIMLYDSNNIQLDGKINDTFSTNVKQLFKSNN
jgi:transketolase